MQVQSIQNNNYKQTFGIKKFRVQQTFVTRSLSDGFWHNPLMSGGIVREYSNPNARDIYRRLKITTNEQERKLLLEQMGPYEIKNMNIIERIITTFDYIWESIQEKIYNLSL